VTATVAAGTTPFFAALNPATNKVYIANKADGTVTVIDGLTNATTTVTVGTTPVAIAVNPVTNKIYVSDYGGSSVTVIDGATNAPTNVAVGSAPGGIALNPVTNKVYVANFNAGNVSVIDGATNTVTATVTAGAWPGAVAVNPVTNRIYIANQESNTVTVIDGATNLSTTIPVGIQPVAVAVNPVTNQIYVADNNGVSGTVTVIDGATNAVGATVPAGNTTLAVAVNPVTNMIYVTNANSGNVTVIDGASNTVAATVTAGTVPYGVAVNPVTNKIYVADNTAIGTVTVIDGATNATTTVTAGSSPKAVAVNPVTDKIYAANEGSANVTVIDGATDAPATVAVGSSPEAVAVNPVTNQIYAVNNVSNNVTVINGATNALVATVGVGGYPDAVAVNPATNMVYVVNLNGTVTVINGANNMVVATVPVGTDPLAVAVNPVTNKIYVANEQGITSVTVIDGATNAAHTVTDPLGGNAYAIAVNSATNMIYVANHGSGNVTVFNGATGTVAATVTVGEDPVAVAVNPVTNMVYVANEYSFTVSVINGATNMVVASPATDANPLSVAVNPATNTVYVANYEGRAGAGDATVINGATNAVIATVATGGNPYAIAVDPATNKVYEANNGGNNVTVIDGATNTAIANVAAGSFPYAVAVNPVTNRIYVPNQGSNTVTVITEQQVQGVPLSASITPLAGNQTETPTPNFNFVATSAFSPTAPAPQNVFFQVDTWQGPWTLATFGSSISGVLLSSATTSPLQQGFHILYAYSDDGQDATSVQVDSPLISNIAAYGFLVVPAVATQFSVNAPAEVTQGIPFSVTVMATDSLGDTVSTYSGTVQFTSTDPAAALPMPPTPLTNGTGTFTVTLNTPSPPTETITATDSVTPSITGTSAAITVGTGAATHFTVSAPAAVTAGSPASVTVTAFDAAGNKATGYTGFVSISSSDPAAGLPSPGMLASGAGAFSVTFGTAGSQTVTATDTVTSSITGVSSSIMVYPGAPPPSAPIITSAATAQGVANLPFSYQITATNSPTGYSAAGLPAFLSINTSTGAISGTPTAAGTYVFTIGATNAGGTGTLQLTVNFTATPLITSSTSVQGMVGSAFSYQITAINSPTSYSAANLPAFLNVNTATGVISGTPTVAGTYVFTIGASNAAGTYILALTIIINPAPPPLFSPVIIANPNPQVALAGGTASFSVSAIGNPAPTYQWLKNGVGIPGANSATLALSNVQDSDVAVYYVIVSNPEGGVQSSFAFLEISAAATAPVITEQPVDTAAVVGDTVSLTVAAEGVPSPTYQWLFNGTAILGATNPVLTLSGLTNAQAGVYSVIVSNSAGTVTSNAATLTVGSSTFAGTYFGNLSNGGTFALYVRADDTGVFLGYAQGSSTPYLDLNVVINPGGGFTVTSSASVAGGPIHTAAVGRAASGRIALDGAIGANGAVSGSIGGVTFSASQAGAGETAPIAGFYEAGASNGSAETFTIVGPSGQCFLLVQTSSGYDGGAGTVTAGGMVSVTTAGGQTFSATISGGTFLMSAKLTSATGSTTTFTGVQAGSAASASLRMVNISSRAAVSGGAQVSIAGFVIGGQQPKTLLIRAVGPTLAGFGVTGALAAPTLTLYSGAMVVAANTGWGSAPNAPELAAAASFAGAFALPSGSADSAILATLPPGAYTAIVSSATGAPGIALVEVYDLSGASPGQELVNLSSRAFAGSGENSLIAGVVVNGAAPKRLLIRAAGPALAQFGVAGTLASPQLTLYSGSAAIAQNAGWSSSADASAIAQAAASVGAFAYAPGSADAAIIINLPPGAYTAQVTGVGGASGISLVEVYEVP